MNKPINKRHAEIAACAECMKATVATTVARNDTNNAREVFRLAEASLARFEQVRVRAFKERFKKLRALAHTFHEHAPCTTLHAIGDHSMRYATPIEDTGKLSEHAQSLNLGLSERTLASMVGATHAELSLVFDEAMSRVEAGWWSTVRGMRDTTTLAKTDLRDAKNATEFRERFLQVMEAYKSALAACE